MRVKLSKAVKLFFSASSLEQVYLEAVSNALDANAHNVFIEVEAESVSKVESLRIVIRDDGEGFTDERFRKFSHLFDVEESSHKGLGRLVYLCYFETTKVSSYYNGNHYREFVFSDSFDESFTEKVVPNHESGTTIEMTGYHREKVAKSVYLEATSVLRKIVEHFYSRFYQYHIKEENICVVVRSRIGGIMHEEEFLTRTMPDLERYVLPEKPDLFSDYEMYYSIKETDRLNPSIITAISIDDRTYQWDIVAQENIPLKYELVFLLYSKSFEGKSDAARLNDTFSTNEKECIKRVFKKAVSSLMISRIPRVAEKNKERQEKLLSNYPHLLDYVNKEEVGLASIADLIKSAQERYFQDQRDILGAKDIDNDQFEKSLSMTSRSLAEYVLFRQKVIEKLRKLDKSALESDIHNLIVPQRNVFTNESFCEDLYRNNIWVLDDKFMTFSTILSEKEMSDLIEVITDGEDNCDEEGRSDIAIVFSGDPKKEDRKVDVVIVELKRKGIGDEQNTIVETQLEKRARKLYEFYKKRIQRVWYYGIVEFDEDYRLHLESNKFAALFSGGNVYYQEKEVVVSREPRVAVPTGMFIMDYDAVVMDAESRNATFLNVLKKGFQNKA